MPNRVLHTTVGTAAGAGFAWLRARDCPYADVGPELLGGALAGYFGSRLPDILDPPVHPNHRSFAHGALPVGCSVHELLKRFDEWQAHFRSLAEARTARAEQSSDALERLWHQFLAFLFSLASGAVIGLPAGYVSHLTLDAVFGRKGLPLVG